MSELLWRTDWQLLHEANMPLLHHAALRTYSRETKALVQAQASCLSVAALRVTANCAQHNAHRQWTAGHPGGTHLPLLRNTPLIVATVWVNVKIIILSERSWKKTSHVILFTSKYRKCKLTCSDGRQVSGHLGMRTRRGITGTELQDHDFEHVPHRNCGDFTSVYLRPKTSNWTFK